MGAAVTAGFLFDVPVRFDTDRLDIELTSFDAAEAPAIPLIEVLRMRTLEPGFAAHIASGRDDAGDLLADRADAMAWCSGSPTMTWR